MNQTLKENSQTISEMLNIKLKNIYISNFFEHTNGKIKQNIIILLKGFGVLKNSKKPGCGELVAMFHRGPGNFFLLCQAVAPPAEQEGMF